MCIYIIRLYTYIHTCIYIYTYCFVYFIYFRSCFESVLGRPVIGSPPVSPQVWPPNGPPQKAEDVPRNRGSLTIKFHKNMGWSFINWSMMINVYGHKMSFFSVFFIPCFFYPWYPWILKLPLGRIVPKNPGQVQTKIFPRSVLAPAEPRRERSEFWVLVNHQCPINHD